jgi:hypothetical protein
MQLFVALFLLVQDDVISVGQENWEKPWVPDLKGGKTTIVAEKRIDVVILGDGYLADEKKTFEKDVQDWYAGFLKLTPWSQLRGAFRVRGLWTPGEGRATPDRKSHYKIPATTSGVGDANTAEMRAAIFASLEKIGHNKAMRRNSYSHAVVVMLIKNEKGRNPSGLTRDVQSPDGKLRIRVAFAAYTHHEFGHAYAGLKDEYINGVGSKAGQKTPEKLSIFGLTNISYTKDPKRLPWAHLSPGSEINPDKESVIGICWLGGGAEEGAWHCEGKCLMNGTHENWDFQKTKRGVNLRDHGRFCFWCEEIAVARTWEKTGQLGESDDGEALWDKWAKEARPLYQKFFDVAGRIKAQNEANAKAGLAEAKIYERPVGE